MLIVGNVDYQHRYRYGEVGAADEEPEPEPLVGGVSQVLRRWDRLKGTRTEMNDIRGLFEEHFDREDCRLLQGREAEEYKLVEEMPNFRWVHIATHGFYARDLETSALLPIQQPNRYLQSGFGDDESDPPLFGRMAVSTLYPGLLSGIALAGANRQSEEEDDGLLTAAEVAELDLHRLEFVVLSACESGLGHAQRGEGLGSLQRAFHLAGVRTVVGSLWRVDDDFTQKLMSAFYEELWTNKKSRIEALRAAQLAMLRREGAGRGLIPVEGHPATSEKRLPPYYWAAFVLSGDFR
jgi:CHAT domain-containing protein